MELSTVAHELYGLPLREFTAARNTRAAEARKAGDRDLAEAVKQLRKPSAGASVANLLVRKQSREIEHLIEVGASLRGTRELDGTRIRQATKVKAEIVGELLGQARGIAKRTGIALSQSIEQELETTLDAAFSDFDSAQALRDGCLTSALHYSGLGFSIDAKGQGATRRPRTTFATKRGKGGVGAVKVTNDLERAKGQTKEAEAELEKARRAVKSAEADLERLRAALSVATRRASRAHEKESAAQKKLDLLEGKSGRK